MSTALSISVSSTIDSETILQKALLLAKKIDLPFFRTISDSSTEYVLAYTDRGLKLLHISSNSSKTDSILYVDFVRGENGYRLANNCTVKQPLARAAGIKSGTRPTVLDATAGFGTDAFVLASLGCNLTMIERSPIVAALLADGLARAHNHKNTRTITGKRMELLWGNSIEILSSTKKTYQTIYLDPMYPHRKKSALTKQEMRFLRQCVGDDNDGDLLLRTALKRAENRVVVKRPKGAEPLADIPPSHTITMKNNRFDIYLTFNLNLQNLD